MKPILRILPLLFFFYACGNGKNDEPRIDKSIDNQEKILLDAVTRYPDSLILRENLAQYYRDNGTYDKAVGVISQAIQKDNTNPRLWDILATLYVENDDTTKAIQAYENAMRIYPDPQYLMSAGALYAQTRNSRALVIADSLLRNKNARAGKEALFIKGLYFTYTGDKKKAINYFDLCLSMDYTYMLAYREKAIALYDEAKYDEALEVLVKAITIQNSFDEGYYWMGRCEEKLNKVEDAIESYRTALQLDPDYIEAKDALNRLGVK